MMKSHNFNDTRFVYFRVNIIILMIFIIYLTLSISYMFIISYYIHQVLYVNISPYIVFILSHEKSCIDLTLSIRNSFPLNI